MSKVIRVSEATYRRLEIHAEGFDTPDAVIQKLLDFREGGVGQKPHDVGGSNGRGGVEPVNLVRTKIISGHFDGLPTSNWNELLRVAHKVAYRELGTFERVQEKTISRIEAEGSVAPGDSGFQPVDGVPILVQNVNIPNAWKGALHLAKELNKSVEVEFRWRKHERALKPGETGYVGWSPDNNHEA